MANKLNVWPVLGTTYEYANANSAASDSFFINGFKSGDTISAKTFNTILVELTTCNKALYNVLGFNDNLVYSGGVAALETVVANALAALSVSSASNLTGTTVGSIPYQSATGVTSFTAAGTSGQLLKSNGTGAPTWVDPSTLAVASASTATSATSAGDVTNSINGKAISTIFESDGTTAKNATSAGACSGNAATATTATNLSAKPTLAAGTTDTTKITVTAGGKTSDEFAVPHATRAAGLDDGSIVKDDTVAGNVVKFTIGEAVYQKSISVDVPGTIDKANNLAGGNVGSLPYQSAADSTTFLAKGTSGQVLKQGASAPEWTNQSDLSVGSATEATTVTGNIKLNNVDKALNSIFENSGAAKNATTAASCTGNAATATVAGAIKIDGDVEGFIVVGDTYDSGDDSTTTTFVDPSTLTVGSANTADACTGNSSTATTVTTNIKINNVNKAISDIFENNGDAKKATTIALPNNKEFAIPYVNGGSNGLLYLDAVSDSHMEYVLKARYADNPDKNVPYWERECIIIDDEDGDELGFGMSSTHGQVKLSYVNLQSYVSNIALDDLKYKMITIEVSNSTDTDTKTIGFRNLGSVGWNDTASEDYILGTAKKLTFAFGSNTFEMYLGLNNGTQHSAEPVKGTYLAWMTTYASVSGYTLRFTIK